MLHILHTPAAAAALRAADLPGDVVVWSRDVSARLAEERGEVVLWFGGRTDEQVAMLAAVTARPVGVPVSFICTEPALEGAAPAQLTWLFHHRPTAGPAFFDLCRRADEAVRAPSAEIRAMLPDLDPLPMVQRALRDLLGAVPGEARAQ